MFSLKENIESVKERIFNSCLKANRNFNDVKLIAVSKQISSDVMREATTYGINYFGENKVQELIKKYDELASVAKFDLIGHLQTNKVKDVIGKVQMIHSIDSVKLASEINMRARNKNIICNALIQINTSREETKYGLDENEFENFIDNIKDLKNIKFNGLMTIGTFTNDEKEIRRCFIQLRKLKEKYQNIITENFNIKELSMGMTSDFEIAIEEGSTILRIGTAIFGARNYL